MTQSSTMNSSKLFLEKSHKLKFKMTSGQCYSKWLLATQLILMLVTVVLSADTHSAQVNSDSEVLSHSISHPISSDNKNVPLKDTHSPPPEQQSSINLTQVWDGVQKFIQSGVNSTATFLELNKRDTEQQTHTSQEGLQSHQPGQYHADNHTVHEDATHDTMHELVLHHHDVGEVQEDSHHEFTTQDENPVETVRLQDILRQIFVDELDSEETNVEEIDENIQLSLNDESGRSDASAHNATKRAHANNYANSTVSRQGRADDNGRIARRRFSKSTSKSGSKSKSTDLSKYNKYMDAVLQRMNAMIKSKRMDPLRVNLYAGPSKKKNGNKNKKNSPRMNLDSEEDDAFDTDEELDGDREPPGDRPATRDIYLARDETTRRIRALLANVSSTGKPLLLSELDEERSYSSLESRDGSARASPDNGTRAVSGGRNKNGSKPSNKKNSKENGQKAKGGSNKNKNSPRPTRGILHGLSTLRRDGNVQVLKQSDRSRLVRAKFLLGPVALEILPKKTNPRTGRGGDQGSKPAATATAPQLKGILEVRLKQGSPTRIKRLRVYPPGNVKVAGDGAKQAGPSGGRVTGRGYNKVTPMATYRLRQVAMQVVRRADRLKQ